MRSRDLAAMLALGAIWGGAFVLLRIASPVFGATALAGVRITVAFLVMVFFVRHWRDLRARALALFTLGVINTAIPFWLFAYAMLGITSGLGALLNATTPIFGILIAWLWLGERLTRWRIAGVAVAFGGVAWLVHGAIGTPGASVLPGVLAALAASICYGVGACFTRRFLSTVDPVVVATGSVLGATLVLAPFSVAAWPQAPLPREAWLAALALGVLCTGIAYLLYYRLLQNVGAGRALAVAFLYPPFGILWGALILHEPVTFGLLAGSAVVLIDTALSVGLVDRVKFAR